MPEFQIETRRFADTTLLVLEGELDVASSPLLLAELSRIGDDDTRLVIDLRGVAFIDSSGLRALLTGHGAAEAAGREFALVRGPRQIDRLLRVTRVAEQLTLLDDFEPAAGG